MDNPTNQNQNNEPNEQYQDILTKYTEEIKKLSNETPIDTNVNNVSNENTNNINLADTVSDPEPQFEAEQLPPSEPVLESGFESQLPEKIEEPKEPIIVPPETGFRSNQPINPILSEEENIPLVPSSTNRFQRLFFLSVVIFLIVLGLNIFALFNAQKKIPTTKQTIVPSPTITTTPTVSVASSSASAKFCELNDKKYSINESFPSADGCNTCTCGEDLSITCTEKLCPTVVPTSTSTSAATLKTYTNANYKFSFQYPQNWTVKELSPTGDQLKTYTLFVQIFESKENIKKDPYGNNSPILSISLVDLKKQNLTFDQYLEKIIKESTGKILGDFTTQNGYKAKHITSMGIVNFDSYLINKNSIVFDLQYGYGDEKEIINSSTKVILDTFKLN